VVQVESGQGGGWQGWLQGWAQARGTVQGCTHAAPGGCVGELGMHGPAWQIRIQLCLEHGSGFPQGFPQEIPSTRHATFLRSSCPPKHRLMVRCVQGGQLSSLWQEWVTGCAHAWLRVHASRHSGGRVPHATGG